MPPTSTVAAVRGALPPHRYSQAEVTEAYAALCLTEDRDRALLARLHDNAGVAHRHLVLPLERYTELSDFGAANDAFIAAAVDLGSEAVSTALADAGVDPARVDLVISVTSTGIVVPPLETRIAERVGLRPDAKRLPLFGLGCVGGAAGIARMHDHLVGHPGDVAVLLTVELCSLTLQRGDTSTPNLIASGLFGDGAAALVGLGADHPAPDGAPRVVTTRSHLYPDTERAMGWDVTGSGLTIVLGAEIPDLVTGYLGPDVRDFLSDNGLSIDDIQRWVTHPGGPKVIRAIEAVLDLPPQALRRTWHSLSQVGNLSSSSVLHLFADAIADPPGPGDPGLLMALGPGFCSELVLLRW